MKKHFYLSLFLFFVLTMGAVGSTVTVQAATVCSPLSAGRTVWWPGNGSPGPCAVTMTVPTTQLLYPKLSGAFIELHAQPLQPGLWTGVQWQNAEGGWHDTEGWQGAFNLDQRVLWYVGEEHLGDGPFRWLVYENEGSNLLAVSQPFALPSHGGEVLRIEVSLGDSLPEAPATISNNSNDVYDNFDNPTYDGTLDATRWARGDGCENVAQHEGVLLFPGGWCFLYVRQTQVSIDQLDLFEARVKVASDHNGQLVTQEITFITDDLPSGIWWATCGIRAEAEGVSTFFNVFSEGFGGDEIGVTQPAQYDQWYTIRLELDSDTMIFSCYADDQLLGSINPQDASALKEARFNRILESARPPGSFATTYVDDVRVANE